MRQVSPATNLLFACFAAVALVAAFKLPWFAPPLDLDPEKLGSIERTATQFGAVFRHSDAAITGQQAFADAHMPLMGVPAAILVLCLLMAVPALRDLAREPLRFAGMGAPLVVGYLLVVQPGEARGNIHWGALAGMALSAFAASAAWHGSALKAPRAAPGAWSRRAV